MIKSVAVIGIILAGSFVGGSIQAESASAATTPDVIVGESVKAAAMTFTQSSGDCEEGAVDVIYGVLKGSRMHEATIVKTAQKLGVLDVDPSLGSNWFAPDGIDALFAHYGIVSKVGSHTIQTIEADLKAGDKIAAFVSAETLWNADLDFIFGAPPAGDDWAPYSTAEGADHALVLDSIDITKSTATVSDTGVGKTYTVPLSVFRAAVATSNYSYAVVQPLKK